MGRGNRTLTTTKKHGLFHRNTEPAKPVQILTYHVQFRNNVTGDIYRANSFGDIFDKNGKYKPSIEQINPEHHPCTVQLIEWQQGDKYGSGARILYEHHADWETFKGLRASRCGGWTTLRDHLNNHPLGQAIKMDTLPDGHLKISLEERMLVIDDVNNLSYKNVPTKQIRTMTVDPEDEASTIASAEFIAEARQTISEYEQARLAINPDAIVQKEANQRRIQEATRLQEVLQQTINEFDDH